jgi:hypothetical protein
MKMERSRSYWPFRSAGKPLLNVKSVDEMKKILLATESVKEAMAQIVAEKLKFYQGTLQLEVSEDKIYREVEA